MPSCSLDDIDLAALKVSEIVQISGIAKAQLSLRRQKLETIGGDVKSFHEIHLWNNNRCGRDFFSLSKRKKMMNLRKQKKKKNIIFKQTHAHTRNTTHAVLNINPDFCYHNEKFI